MKRVIANSGKVGEFVAGDIWGRLVGVAAGDSEVANLRASLLWFSLTHRYSGRSDGSESQRTS
jgi:hypothetical protein